MLWSVTAVEPVLNPLTVKWTMSPAIASRAILFASSKLDRLPLIVYNIPNTLYIVKPGMARDCHDDLPACLLASWTPEQLDYMHDMT